MPVHLYGDVAVFVDEAGRSCFLPGDDGTGYELPVTLADHVDTGGDGKPDAATIVVSDVPSDGFAYVAVHLDYGLKGGDERYLKAQKLGGLTDAVDEAAGVVIEDHTTYLFLATAGSTALTGDSIINVNDFKKLAGIGGFVWDEVNDPVVGAEVRLTIPASVRYPQPFVSAITDEDGWYMIAYKHRGKAATFQMEVRLAGSVVASDQVRLGANSYAEVSFTVTP